MAFFRTLSLSIIFSVVFIITLLLIPASHAWALSKITTFFLEVPARFEPPKMGLDTYSIRGRLGTSAQVQIRADHTTLEDTDLALDFHGDLALFSKIAKAPLPTIAIDLNASLDKTELVVHAELLDGSLDAALALNTLTYHAKANGLSLLSFQRQQQIEPYVEGTLALVSQGELADILDIDLTLKSSDMHLLAPTLTQIGAKQKGPAPAALDASFTLKDKRVVIDLHLDSTVALLKVEHLEYRLDDGGFDARLDLHNRLEAYRPLKKLQIHSKGHYFEERLNADVLLNADDYILRLDDIKSQEERLSARYSLHSSDQDLVDITPKHKLFGDLIYTPKWTEANITSNLLDDIITLRHENSSLRIDADTLSLRGLLQHLRQKPMASATLALAADIDLEEPLRWKSSLATTDLLLAQELTDALGQDGPITLKVKAYNPDERHIIIKPTSSSSMMHLEKSSILYDLNESKLTMTGKFKDLNISYYQTPSLSLQSQLDLKGPLQLKADILSPYEKIDLTLSHKEKQFKGLLHFDFKEIDRMPALEALQELSGSIDFDTLGGRHHFVAHLSDLNSTYYDTPFADINGTVRQGEKLTGMIDLKTPFEKIRLDFTHKDDHSDARFDFDVTRLDRFASLDQEYTSDGSGRLSYDDKVIGLDIDSKQFGEIKLTKDEDVMELRAGTLPLAEFFALTGQEAIVDGILSLKAQMMPSHINAVIDASEIRVTEQNASFRPTSLLATLELDGNSTRYDGSLDVKTEYEHLRLDHLRLLSSPASFSSDLLLASDDLTQGTPILLNILVGPSRFTGKVKYDKKLHLSLKNKKISLDEQTHKRLDENASGTLDIRLSTDLVYDGTQADIDIFADSPYFTLKPSKTHIDLNDSLLRTKTHLTTDLWQKDSDIALTMHYKRPLRINGTVETAYETLSLEHLLIDSETHSMDGDYRLLLRKTSENAAIKHGEAEFHGRLSSDPVQQATLQSDSFGGDILLVAAQQEIQIESEAVRLEKVMKFLAMDSSLRSGLLDLDATFHSDDFLELDLTTMKGDISIDATDLILEGIDVDKNVDMLKNYQDISLFKGNFPGKGIMTSIIKAPVTLIEKKKIKHSQISRFHVDSYIDDGRIYCYDCALKSKRNQIAFKGAIDLNTTELRHFQVGLLKKDGCAFFTQDIKGSVKEPKVELSKTSLALVTGTLKSIGGVVGSGVEVGTEIISGTGELAGNIIDTTTGFIPLVNKATGTVSGTIRGVSDVPEEVDEMLSRRCIPFYRGVVRHPDRVSVP